MKGCVRRLLPVSNERAVDTVQASAAVHTKNSEVQAITGGLAPVVKFHIVVEVIAVRGVVAIDGGRLCDCHSEGVLSLYFEMM